MNEIMPISEARKRMNANFKRLIAEGLTPSLRSKGFRRKGWDHWRDLASGISYQVLVYRASHMQPANATEFYLDCMVGIHAYFDLFPERKAEFALHKSPSHIFVRPKQLSSMRYLDPWCLPENVSEDGLRTIARNLADLTNRYIVPWFGQFRGPKDVGDYLGSSEPGPGRHPLSYREVPQQAPDLRNAAIAYFGAGEYGRARQMLRLAETTIDRHGRHMTADLRERMERLIARWEKEHA
jgi:hypothetical protein